MNLFAKKRTVSPASPAEDAPNPSGRKKGKNGKPNKRKKLLLSLIILLVLAGGGYFSFTKYVAYKKALAEQMRLEEEERAKRAAEEKARKELEEARSRFDQILQQMRVALNKNDCATVRKLAAEATKIAKTHSFSLTEVTRMLGICSFRSASRSLSLLESQASDIYAYQRIRTGLRKIPRLSGIASRWDSLMQKTYLNEYLVLLELAERSVTKALAGDGSERNYSSSKLYLSHARTLAAKRSIPRNISQETSIAETQNRAFFAHLQKTTQPVRIYR
jgi:ElaB/YqjD/DUF883 family membrane-anchored ribosome-binding protein